MTLPASADVVIVGAGSAGCVLAEKLSRNPDRSVVLVERGPGTWPGADDLASTRLPVEPGATYAMAYPERSGAGVVRGSGLGGSSVVNGGYFLRWHRGDFDGWPTGWELDVVSAAYSELDAPGGTMGVAPVSDAELGDVATAFERYWAPRVPVRMPAERWPVVGLNRVLGNRDGALRMSAAQAYLRPAAGRPNLTIVTGERVETLCVANSRTVTGVRSGSSAISAGEVILSAGTLGTAGILLRSDLDLFGPAPGIGVAEHRSLAVTYRRRIPADAGTLLPSVVHTEDRIEIRCYRDDFASFIRGLEPSAAEISLAAMYDAPGREWDVGGSAALEFDPVDDARASALRVRAEEVQGMLESSGFAEIVAPGSVRIDSKFGVSQHCWGSMPMGERVDWLGGVHGVGGLRIVDGSILPTGGRSGPHATIMMVACRIGDLLATR